MSRILLPLLLCLSLLAGTVGAAWASTAMAMPVQAGMTHDADHACCVEEGSHAGDSQPAPACGNGQHCDCMQHCNLLPVPVVAQPASLSCSPEPSALRLPRHDVTPDRLHRPPIA
ncbi:exported hypothetical protein [uncultured Stenotrophomonas sp.]|uniref:CopL family metal-binding regulatory protein n=1 Tax=uncultured Stenotrophomonas sp. TaxID=165438 RepID=A0A1Y5Q6X4_9GAMM|nr:exported hypothetical protein [uncultured Stenotrophomonas sp.]